jgi:exodeoxyribonuclease VII small subunit
MPAKKEYKDFESAIARLEEIVAALESGEHSLEESIALYSEGVTIAGICNKKLADAEGQIAKLSKMAEKFQLDKFTEENGE